MRPGKVVEWLRLLGPGLIAGSSDDDPSGIGTYAIAGAQQKFLEAADVRSRFVQHGATAAPQVRHG